MDTDVFPEITAKRPSTGGFAALATPQRAYTPSEGSYLPAPDPGSGPGGYGPGGYGPAESITGPPPAPGAFGPGAVAPPSSLRHDNSTTPSVASSPAWPVNPAPDLQPVLGSGSYPGPPTTGVPTAGTFTAPPNRDGWSNGRPARGPLLIIGALAAALLVTVGILGGVLLAGGGGGSGQIAQSAVTAATSTPTTTASTRATSTSTPTTRVATTAASTASSSTVPAATVVPSTGAAPADPNALAADFLWTPDPAQAGRSVTISDQSRGGATRWVWTWNGNVVSSSQPKGFTTTLRENTPITLTVCRGNGSTDCHSVTKMVPVS